MPITPDEAAAIAREAGLTLTDASALRNLADNRDEAVALAERFRDLPPPPEIDYSSDTARRRSVLESISAKTAHLRRVQAATDHNGRITDTDAAAARTPPSPTPAGTPDTPSVSKQTPVEQLHSGAPQTPPPEPNLAEQIAEAEKAGDWPLARQLKTSQLIEIRNRQEGTR